MADRWLSRGAPLGDVVSARIGIWREDDGRWRWAYADGDLELMSNGLYASEEEARAAAHLAYPDVPLDEAATGVKPVPRRPSRWSLLLSVAALWRSYRRARRS
jgi:hypothetical protein